MDKERKLRLKPHAAEQACIKPTAIGDMVCGAAEAGIGVLAMAGAITMGELAKNVRLISAGFGLLLLFIAAVTISDYFKKIVFYETEMIYYENFSFKQTKIAYSSITAMRREEEFLKTGKKAPFYKIYADGKVYAFKYSDFKNLEEIMMEVQDALKLYAEVSNNTEEKTQK